MKTRLILLFTLFASILTPHIHAQSQGRVAALHTIGAQGAVVVYNTYCLIGAMNDGYVSDAWEKDVVTGIMDEQMAVMQNVCDEYDSLLISGYLDEEDSTFVADMRDCCQLLKTEASCLRQYVIDDSEESHNRYLEARDAAWKKVQYILGLDEETTVQAKNPFAGTK